MRTLAILAMTAALAGCASSGPNLSTIMQTCGYAEKPFVVAWPCVKAGFAGAALDTDLKGVYIANGDVAAEQVAAGRMTDAEARLKMAEVRQKVREAAEAREAGNPIADAIVLGGILNRPQPTYTAPPVYTAPSAPVNCYRVGTSLQCY